MSAQTYLGTFPVDISTTEFANFGPSDWAMYFIGRYGQIDGGHHKAWVLDQVARVLSGSPVIVEERRWTDHKPELDAYVGEPSQSYVDWRQDMLGEYDDENDEHEYDYDEGCAP